MYNNQKTDHCRQPTIVNFAPGGLYDVETVAAFFRVTCDTLRDWVRAGRFKTAPRPSNRSPIRIFGESVVEASGMSVRPLDLKPATMTELARRAKIAKRIAEGFAD